ncbi:dentin sialophosphoprotein isoform X6 [Apis mellifera]|uniref:Dentin sialophosphoprotein isoform X6 n=1 Tax=Apis mellifera TaxID=7460 RepID=A0A7M7GP10_APIME|nr:dentin sialophosphoprotein isoform X6 [Apis mellifera]|eukprot:XP_006561700.2 dentin sialophosphoprotein isoform X6 [Apis mellifera]
MLLVIPCHKKTCLCHETLRQKLNLAMENERNSIITTSRKEPEGITGWIESVIMTVSQTSIGQALFKFIDSFLWVVEKSTQWSLPAHEIAAEENGKVFGRIELVRPLPWLLFLPGLVILRIIRCGLNVGAFILGYPRIRPSGMVKFVQKTRRRLRAINVKAIKARRRITCAKIATPEEKSTTESVGSPVLHEMKRKFSQILDDESSDGSDNETLRAKLERLAMENSTDDSDFNIADCSTESSTGSSENDVDKEISFNETIEIQREACNFLKDDTYQLMSLKLQIAKSMKDEGTKDGGKLEGVDSSESAVEKASNTIKDFINGEINSALQQSSTVSESTIPEDIEEKKASKETATTEASTLPKSDSSPPKENSSEVSTSPKSRSPPSKENSSEYSASEVSSKARSSPSKESPSKAQTQTETLPKSRDSPSKQSCSETSEEITLPKFPDSPSKENCSETSEEITQPKSRDSPSKENCSETSEATTQPKSRDSPSKKSCSETSEATTQPKSRDSPSKKSCSETSEATTQPKSRDSPSKKETRASEANNSLSKTRNSPSKECSTDTRGSEAVSALSRTRRSPSKENYSIQGKSYYKSKKYGRNRSTWTEQ